MSSSLVARKMPPSSMELTAVILLKGMLVSAFFFRMRALS
jgi:hypothetical protein